MPADLSGERLERSRGKRDFFKTFATPERQALASARASLMIAAGVNVKALSAYMGHSSVTITMERYGHLMSGNESEGGKRLEAYLAQAVTAAPTAV